MWVNNSHLITFYRATMPARKEVGARRVQVLKFILRALPAIEGA